MKPVKQSEVEAQANRVGLIFERWTEGTVRISQPGPPRWVPLKPSRAGADICPAYLIGREAVPPLAELRSRFRILQKNRCVHITRVSELRKVLAELLSKGWCVNNDAYVFSSNGKVLVYAGHHDELDQWTRTESPNNILHPIAASRGKG